MSDNEFHRTIMELCGFLEKCENLPNTKYQEEKNLIKLVNASDLFIRNNGNVIKMGKICVCVSS